MDAKLITNIVVGIVLGAIALMLLPFVACTACNVCAGAVVATSPRRSSPAPEPPAEPAGEPCAAHGMRNCSLCRDQR